MSAVSGELKKLTIIYERPEGRWSARVAALFNPGQIQRSHSVSWDAPPLAGHGGPEGTSPEAEFQSVSPGTLTVELFFDTYEPRSDGSTDVRDHTDRVAGLAAIDPEMHRPPVCRLRWGEFDVFSGVLTDLTQTFTMFLENGTPVRATLSCTFLEVIPQAQDRENEQHSADVPRTRRLTLGDTLPAIAAREYGDPALWREIAHANKIVDPRLLTAGDVLIIPRLRAGGR